MAGILGRNDIGLRKDVAGSRTQVIHVADRRTHDVKPAAIFSGVRHRPPNQHAHERQPVYKRVAARSQNGSRAVARGVRRVHVADARRTADARHRGTRGTRSRRGRIRQLRRRGGSLYAARGGVERHRSHRLPAASRAAGGRVRRLRRSRGAASREARNGATVAQQQASTVLLARLELAEGRPQAALDMLAALPQALPEQAQRDAAAVRGQALFRVGRPVEAVRALVEREVWLTDADAILANQRMIWDGFRASPAVPAAAATGDPVVDGWLALAPLTASTGADLRRSLLGWRQTYPSHPAAAGLLAELLAAQRSTAFPSQIALLLPLSSPQRAFALAIRDGFMAAHLRNANNSTTSVRVYDSARLGSSAGVPASAARRRRLHRRAAGAHRGRPSHRASGVRADVGAQLRDERHDVARAASTSSRWRPRTKRARSRRPRSRPARRRPSRSCRAIKAAIGSETLSAPRSRRPAARCSIGIGYEPALQDFSQPTAALLNVTRSASAPPAARRQPRRARAVSRSASPPGRRHDLRRRRRPAARGA